jgi:hypothetical protein
VARNTDCKFREYIYGLHKDNFKHNCGIAINGCPEVDFSDAKENIIAGQSRQFSGPALSPVGQRIGWRERGKAKLLNSLELAKALIE